MDTFTIETISPLHIGSGDEISPMSYFLKDYFYRLDMDSLFRDPAFDEYSEVFIKRAAENRYIGDWAPADLLQRHILYKAKFDVQARAYLLNNQIMIKEYIKSAGRPYIPGSSIKGAVLGALLWHVLKDFAEKHFDIVESLLINEHKKYDDLLGLGFSLLTGERVDEWNKARFFKWASLSDSSFLTETLPLVSIVQVKGTTKNMIPIGYECMPANVSLDFSFYVEKCKFSLEKIWAICDAFYTQVAQKYPQPSIDKKDGALLRLGQGSSSFATSFLLLAEDLRIYNYGVKEPKTRKETLAEELMGWTLVRGAHVRQSKTQLETQTVKDKKGERAPADSIDDLAAAWGAKLNKK